jgi:hypothetical protein
MDEGPLSLRKVDLVYKRTYNTNQPNTEVPEIRMQPPADAPVFKFSNGYYWYTVFGTVVFAGFTGLCLAIPLFDRRLLLLSVLGVAFFGTFAGYFLRYLRCLRDSVAVNPEGIWYLPRKGDCTFLAWNEVAKAKDDEPSSLYSRLVLADATARRQIRLDYRLEDFERLREFVIEHTAAARCQPPIRVFHRTWYNKIIFGGFIVFFLSIAVLCHGNGGASLFFLGFAMIPLVSIAQDSTRLEIRPDAIVILYPGWSRSVSFNTITGIRLANMSGGKGPVLATVIVQRLKGSPINLAKFREGSIALYEELLSAWKTA